MKNSKMIKWFTPDDWKEYNHKRYERDREKRLKYQREYYQKNRDRERKRHEKYYRIKCGLRIKDENDWIEKFINWFSFNDRH